ncbi:MAG: T9SS type A sorting domain-containing protein [bacterium]
MKKFCTLFLILFPGLTLIAQNDHLCVPCLPQGITFTTQSLIDSFPINYPNCTTIEGEVFITGTDVTDLNGLSVLTYIGGSLTIYENNSLTSLTGLENLTSIGSYLWISFNYSLTSLTALDSLTSIGGYIAIDYNNALTSLTGLGNIDASSITNLQFHNNNSLSTCAVQSICDYLANPTGTIEIHDNAIGCNSVEEVKDSCAAIGIESLTPESSVTIYPNPASTDITISIPTTGSLSILNLNGQEILQQEITEPTTTVDVSGLKSGVYFVRVKGDKNVSVGKFVKQ